MNKKILYGIIALAVVLLGIGAYVYYEKTSLPSNAVLTKDPQLTDSEKQSIRDKINEYTKQLQEDGKNDNDRYKLQIQIGLQHFLLGEYEQAREQYLKATKILPDNPTAWAELYVVENTMQAYEFANEHIKKAIDLNSLNPQYWRWYLELGQGPIQANEAQLRDTYRLAMEKTDSHVDIITLYAKFLEQHNDLPGAVQEWRKAVQKNPAGKAQYEAEIARIQEKLK